MPRGSRQITIIIPLVRTIRNSNSNSTSNSNSSNSINKSNKSYRLQPHVKSGRCGRSDQRTIGQGQ